MSAKRLGPGRWTSEVFVPLIAASIIGGATWLTYCQPREASRSEPTAHGTASPQTEQQNHAPQGKALLQSPPTPYHEVVEIPPGGEWGDDFAIAREAKPRLAFLTPLAALPGFEAFPWRLDRGMTRDEVFDASDRVAALRDNGDLSIPADFEVFGLKIHRMEVSFSPFDSQFEFVVLHGRSTLTADEVPAHRRRVFAAFKQALGLPFDEQVDMIEAHQAGYRVFLDYAVDADGSGSGFSGQMVLGPVRDAATTYHHRITVGSDPAVTCVAFLRRC